MKPISIVHWMTAIADRGRALLDMQPALTDLGDGALGTLCRALMGRRGEATGTAIAREIAVAWQAVPPEAHLPFFAALARDYDPDPDVVAAAAAAFVAAPGPATQIALFRAAEAPRQELLRRINLAPGGTAALVSMRAALLVLLPAHPELAAVDADFRHLFASWFNRGFLELRAINWDTPASILEKLIRYEAVHEIDGWSDLRRRLEDDRRCFAFFHPAMPDEPLVFVEVALTGAVSREIAGILAAPVETGPATTAVFYSISNCQTGLRGISFGNFLIKQVVDELRSDLPGLREFVTLSPIPGFAAWLRDQPVGEPWLGELQSAVAALPSPPAPEALAPLRRALTRACALYLVSSSAPGVPADPVARFHLGNGAQLMQINWLADVSPRAMRQSLGMMVNYAYRLDDIVRNHERLLDQGEIVAARAVRRLAGQKV